MPIRTRQFAPALVIAAALLAAGGHQRARTDEAGGERAGADGERGAPPALGGRADCV